jgi:hypothetical protein
MGELPASRRNFAALAGGWSARHRRKAIVGWLVFVVAAYVIGTAIGQRRGSPRFLDPVAGPRRRRSGTAYEASTHRTRAQVTEFGFVSSS